MYVSVNAFGDTDLLRSCLESITETCPEAYVAVVDGRYETHPAPDDNTPGMAAACARYDAEYWPDGPFPSEAAKHRQRVHRAPAGERCLFIDADERLLACDTDHLDAETAYWLRIYNVAIYGGVATYYKRYFTPRQFDAVPHTDHFRFDADLARTDAITLVHRADLRDAAYRAAKRQRMTAEGRDDMADWLRGQYATDAASSLSPCPECGESTLARSQVTAFGADGAASRVACCLTDGCYAAVEPYDVGEWRYLPDAIERGAAEDLERLRIEFMAAGWPMASVTTAATFDSYVGVGRLWADEHLA